AGAPGLAVAAQPARRQGPGRGRRDRAAGRDRQRGRRRARAVRRRVQRHPGASRARGAGGSGEGTEATVVAKEEPMRGLANRLFATAVAAVAWSASTQAKECYAPDARSQERAFSRAVVTDGGKVIWLGGQTGLPAQSFDEQVHHIFGELEKTIKAV